MTQHQGGLRFDIYERVHLTEGVAGIKELEEVELVPHIQVLPQGEQALLKGNLLLTGTYMDEYDAVNRTLEHLIPVEITLPMNRVQRVEDISVEIDNFDVDLLSTRSLNITGVLSLNGLESVSESPGESWGEAEEEVVFVHESPSQLDQDIDRDEEQQPSEENAHFENSSTLPVKSGLNAQALRVDFPAEEAHAVSAAVHTSNSVDAEAEHVAAQAAEYDEQAEPVMAALDSAPPDEKKELKVAFSGKRPEESKPVSSNGLASLLGSPTGKIDGKSQEEPEQEMQTVSSNQGGKLEWKKLLLNSMSERQEFRRVRLCIVQKEETLETIAKRYELNPREIALFNRLGESELTEGQIVYIPK
ncbi:LysM peptidoglycan-binding domain-containing protein [Paenibacillus piri]|uniref:LysM peptidoglycan-binding domain-containing protein n=1 Tax=Paenibacillus piri TaxID=2547395 RepID=A0A4R5KRK2_9BACL|nr:LysM peptidoglycan-binding domain-containing protein [Paenibacillus piri]TDF97628.1 LysM peptidoglycan-binding domain-containing protein [Paenibacillus piri]